MLARLSANVTMTPSWNLGQCIEAWVKLGIPAIGIIADGLKAYGVERGIDELRASGLGIANYQGVRPYGIVEPERFEARWSTTLEHFEIAAALGADCVYVLPGPRKGLSWDQAADRLVEQTRLMLPALHERGVRLALEPVHPLRQDLTFLSMLDDVVELVDRVGDPSVGYVFDFWHLWWQRRVLELAGASATTVLSVQPSDHKPVTKRSLDRAMLGEGLVDIEPLLRALEDGGYMGRYDLEVISPDNEERGYEKTLTQAIGAFEGAWERAFAGDCLRPES